MIRINSTRAVYSNVELNDEMNITEESLKQARNFYSKEWITSSFEYDKKGYYQWCLNAISGKKRILEIGCGGGLSTNHLLSNNYSTVSIDENPDMIKSAAAYLRSKNHKIETIRRERFIFNDPTYRIEYSDLKGQINSQNLLIEGDFLTDNNLIKWLSQQDKFDAIICWFIGVHGAIAANESHRSQYEYLQHNPTNYRTNLHRELFNKSSQLLNTGGIISIIDRTQFFENETQKSDALEYVKFYYQLEDSGFEIVYMDQKEVEDPTQIKGVSVKKTYNNQVVDVEKEDRFALTSIICIKK